MSRCLSKDSERTDVRRTDGDRFNVRLSLVQVTHLLLLYYYISLISLFRILQFSSDASPALSVLLTSEKSFSTREKMINDLFGTRKAP